MLSKILKISSAASLISSIAISGAIAGTYVIDKPHTDVSFSVTHLMISTVRGTFKSYTGSVEIDEKTGTLTNIQSEVETNSIFTDDEKRDKHLRSSDFFDAEKFPKITFKSTSVEKTGEKDYIVKGDLTIRGVTKPITLNGKMIGLIQSKDVGNRAGFKASGKINRQDFGVSWNKTLDFGGVAVSDEVEIKIEVEALQKQG